MENKIQELLIALRNVDSAKQAHDEAMIQCEHSWGYHGWRYIKALEDAEEDFSNALLAVIDERLKNPPVEG